MGSNYVRIQSYVPLSNSEQNCVDDVDIDVALSSVVRLNPFVNILAQSCGRGC